ncbi:unnamed protein product, partial [Laminaria digitata]
YTTAIRESVAAVWALNGGNLLNVAGINAVTADVAVSGGFSGPTDGQRFGVKWANSNTGAMTLDTGNDVKAVVRADGTATPAGTAIAGTQDQLEFLATSDHYRILGASGTTNVTVQGGIILQRSLPTRLVTTVAETMDETQLLSRAFQASYDTSRIVIEGSISRKHGADTDAEDGLSIALFVDGVSEQVITDAAYDGAAMNTAFAFEYTPGDAISHTYVIKATATVPAAYHASSTFMVASEFSPNA